MRTVRGLCTWLSAANLIACCLCGGLANLANAAAPAAAAAASNAASDPVKAAPAAPAASTPSSAPGDYIGDCFQISAAIADPAMPSGSIWQVTDQSNTTTNDRTLTLVPARFPVLDAMPPCKAIMNKSGQGSTSSQATVSAGKLLSAGANRYGWTYGVLTMPYKYYPRLHSFQGSAPIGGYLGWRTGQAGSGVTWAASVTLSSVKADTVDPKTLVDGKPQVTGSTDAAALSLAIGWIFDLSKSQGASPFKAGAFVGVDKVNSSPSVNYKYNSSPWIAIQLGYDFTSN